MLVQLYDNVCCDLRETTLTDYIECRMYYIVVELPKLTPKAAIISKGKQLAWLRRVVLVYIRHLHPFPRQNEDPAWRRRVMPLYPTHIVGT